jgi:hypothetical protein
MKNNVFSRTKTPMRQNLVVFLEIEKNEEEPIEDGVGAHSRIGERTNTTKSKILTHFLKRKISFTPMETIPNVHSELEYFEGLVKLAKKR